MTSFDRLLHDPRKTHLQNANTLLAVYGLPDKAHNDIPKTLANGYRALAEHPDLEVLLRFLVTHPHILTHALQQDIVEEDTLKSALIYFLFAEEERITELYNNLQQTHQEAFDTLFAYCKTELREIADCLSGKEEISLVNDLFSQSFVLSVSPEIRHLYQK